MKYLEAERERLRRIAANAERVLKRGTESGVFEIPTRRIARLSEKQRQAAEAEL